MTKPGSLPERRDQDAVDDDLLVVERVEGEACPAKRAHNGLHAEIRVEQPLPDQPGHDEGQREGIEEDRAEGIFEADLLVHQRCQHEADDEREDQHEDAVDSEVLDRDIPARRGPQSVILLEADETSGGAAGANW
jgi:hypothetical protein